MVSVEFVKLNRPERAQILCDLAEEYYLAGQRVLIMVQDENQGVTLDRFMWTWKKGTFVPHVYDNGSIDSHDESVVIVDEPQNPNGADVLIMGSSCDTDFMKQFKKVIDFAEAYDDDCLEESRNRFRIYREHGFNPVMR